MNWNRKRYYINTVISGEQKRFKKDKEKMLEMRKIT